MSRNLDREREREVAREAWAKFVWGRTHNVAGRDGMRNQDGGGRKSRGVNAVIIRPGKKTKRALGGEPFGKNGRGDRRRLPSKPYVWPRHRS